ncbi:MAG: dihydroorotate dehydrogenase [Syntrophomonadaceae bacterium]|nr:dihydroorotate dehydrogenase [Syntrophomonadaceae bacterium]
MSELKQDKRPDVRVNLGGLQLDNPVTVASGTFGYGREYEKYLDISKLGALIITGTTLAAKTGNIPPRIYETPSGMLNAIGLENPGIDVFLKEHLPYLREKNVTVIANIAGNTLEEYAELAAILQKTTGLAALELNISCPNVEKGGLQFGTSPKMVAEVVKAVKNESSLPVIPKLSPNVTDIVEIALAAEEAGADALSMINTLIGMAVDIRNRRPVLGNIIGGLSGPAIKPVALRMVYQVYQAVNIPILGGGGIMNYEDAIEFFMVGASAISVGTANFVNPRASIEIEAGIRAYLLENKLSLNELVGIAVR